MAKEYVVGIDSGTSVVKTALFDMRGNEVAVNTRNTPVIEKNYGWTLIAAKRGRVNLFGGLPKGQSETLFDSNIIHYKELFVHGTSDSTILQMMDVLELMSSGQLKVSDVITKTLPLSQYEEGFICAANGSELKVVLQPGR